MLCGQLDYAKMLEIYRLPYQTQHIWGCFFQYLEYVIKGQILSS
jgi:hypothetical protein